MANKNFMDLIKDSTTNPALVSAFITELDKAVSGKDLKKWFKGKGYSLSTKECNKIFEMKIEIKNLQKGPHVMY